MEQSDIADFFPILGKRVRGEKNIPFKRAILSRTGNKTGRKGSFSKTGGHYNRGSKASHVRSSALFSQRCIVKARIIKLNEQGKKAAALHLKYVLRDGVEKDGSKGKLFGPKKGIKADDFATPLEGEPHQFRLIVSPENAHDLDLTDFSKKLMQQIEKDLGRQLKWAAVNHYNTDNPHTHIIIRGLDSQGKEVRIDREYISNGIRKRAMEIATAELGLRTECDIEKQYAEEIKAERFTSLDYQIEQKIDQQNPSKNVIDLGVFPENKYQRVARIRLLARLEFLEKMGLANNSAGGVWELTANWKQSLKDMGQKNDIIKTMHARLQGDPSRYSIVNDKSAPFRIEGRLTAKGLADELYDKYFLVVEGINGNSYYVNVHRGIKHEELKEGGIVSLAVQRDHWLKTSDKNISDIALKNKGIYSTELHMRGIGSNKIKVKNKFAGKGEPEYFEIDAKEFVSAHEKRLYKLQQYGLAEKIDNSQWRVAGNLIQELTKRDREIPINQIRVNKISNLKIDDQATYKGRVWIDQFVANPSDEKMAKYGFGSEVSRCARIRSKFLLEMGLQEGDSELGKRLDKIETRIAIDEIKNSKKMVFRSIQDFTRLKGEIELLELKSGRRLAVISDCKTKEFTIAPWEKKYEQIIGNQVDVQMDHAGKIVLRKTAKAIGR